MLYWDLDALDGLDGRDAQDLGDGPSWSVSPGGSWPTAAPTTYLPTLTTAPTPTPTPTPTLTPTPTPTPTYLPTARPYVSGVSGKKNELAQFWLASDQSRLAGGACHERPWPCLQQLVIGTLAIGVAWTAIAWYVDAKPPNVRHLLKFWAIYLPVAFLLRWMDVEIQDKLAIAAGMTIGNKMVQILTAA